MNKPDGYYVPVYKALTEKIQIAGAPRDFVILNLMIGVTIGFIMKLYPLMILNFILHVIAMSKTKKDPQFFDAMKRHIKHKVRGIYLGT